MNLSGIAVKNFLDFYNHIENIVVIHDDLDLPFAKVKIKTKGGDGGHRGIASIITSLNRNNFLRIKVGIGKPANKNYVKDFVLSDFTRQEQLKLKTLINQISNSAIILAITGNLNLAYKFLNPSN